MEEKKVYGLYAVLHGLRKHLESRMKNRPFWLKAELAQINMHSSGHCYLQLSETRGGKAIAQCRGTIWQSEMVQIKKTLGNDFDHVLKKGNEVLCWVEMEFTEQYGLAVVIKDIDINFSLGALEKRRQQTINQLDSEGLLHMNKSFVLPRVIQRIAIVGAPDSAGIEDLMKQLDKNAYGYCFHYEVFPCLVQGDKAAAGIVSRLKQLRKANHEVVALVRGGGSKLDLDVFNDFFIAKEIATHPKPVFVGIGHETDVVVADLVAHTSHKTPSALGSYIVERAFQFESRMQQIIQAIFEMGVSGAQLKRGALHTLMNRMLSFVNQSIGYEANKLALAQETLRSRPVDYLGHESSSLRHLLEMIQLNSGTLMREGTRSLMQKMELATFYAKQKIRDQQSSLARISGIVSGFDPTHILRKGYGIPTARGNLLADQQMHEGDLLDIHLLNRTVTAAYIKEKKHGKDDL